MHAIDFAIVAGYLLGLITVGLVLAKRASRSEGDYFLGGRTMPWWTLGASGMSSNLDAAGTMTILTLIYLFGLHGFFIEMRGGVVLPIAIFLAFMGKWHQRSNVTTTAEWMILRFGDNWQGRAARYTAALTYLVITIAMVTFFVAAAGKFIAVFLPFGETTCQIGIAAIALFYTMISGLYGVVWTDVFQAALIGGAAVYVAVQGWLLVSPELLEQWPGAALNDVIPHFRDDRIEGYELFGFFLLAWTAKGMVEGFGGSGGSAYMAQRFYASHTDADTHKIGLLWTLLFAFRWPMVLGFAIIAIHLGVGQNDPERILPLVLSSEFFPIGIRGIVIAAIFAASMSTFDSTINAGASYVVKDLYEPFARSPSQRRLVAVGWIASILIVVIGLWLALTIARSVVDVWVTIVIQLFPAFLVPFALRWFWSRFNGAGFAGGVLAGFAAATVLAFFDFGLNEAETLALTGAVSLIGSVAATYAASPVDRRVLKNFYRQVRPAGLWPSGWKTADLRREHRGDAVRTIVALVWQITTFLAPMTLVVHMYGAFAALLVVWLALGAWLVRDVRVVAAREESHDAERAVVLR